MIKLYIHAMEYYLPKTKREQIIDTCNIQDDSPENYAEWKKSILPILYGYMLYDAIYLTFFKWWKYRNGEQTDSCQWLRKGRVWEKSGCGSKRQHIDSYSDGSVLFLECSDVNIWVWYWTIVLQDLWGGNWVKGTQDLSEVFPNNCMWIYDYFKEKFKKYIGGAILF